MRGHYLFHSESNSIVSFQPYSILISIYQTLDLYCRTDCSKIRPSHRIQISSIQTYLLCCLLSSLGLDTHTFQKCKNKFLLFIPCKIPRLFLVHSIEPFFFGFSFCCYYDSLCLVLTWRIWVFSADTSPCLTWYFLHIHILTGIFRCIIHKYLVFNTDIQLYLV